MRCRWRLFVAVAGTAKCTRAADTAGTGGSAGAADTTGTAECLVVVDEAVEEGECSAPE